MDNILIGTASWTDKTLIDCQRFYPPAARTAEARLRYYATQFPIVEVDSSYYALPSAANARLWVERTPADFTFNMKSFRLFTGHQTPPEALPRDLQAALGPALPRTLYYRNMPGEIRDELWRRFLEAIAPLREAGRLGLVLFQFAPWLVRGREAQAHVAHCVERMAGHRIAVEFRHQSWFGESSAPGTLDWLRALRAVHTIVDEPQGFANCVPAVWAATDPDYALLRLHGRNAAAWNRKGLSASSSRFDHYYSPEELGSLIPSLRAVASRVRHTHVLFNTNFEDQGQVNARLLGALLEEGAPAKAG